jgi:hypothetical protein
MSDVTDLLRARDPNAPAELKPTPRSRGWGALSDVLRAGRDVANKADLPLVGPLGDFALGKAPEEVNEWSYGNLPVQINPMAGRTASYVPEIKRGRKEGVADVLGALQGIPKGNRAAVAALTGAATPGPVDVASYLTHLPSKPNPKVGTRFEREMVGQMAEKKPQRIEDLEGASLTAMPWDLTSRGQRITSISDEKLPNPITTTGGQDFARDIGNIEAGVGGASNLGIAKRIQARNEQAAREGLAKGGSGRVVMLPATMGPESEFFSTMPSDALVQLLRGANLGKKDIKALNEMVRTAPVKKPGGMTRPFGGFAGFEDPDLEMQLSMGLGRGAPAGELRKAVASQLSKVGPQKMIGYNREDLAAALTDPALAGVGKGYVGNTLIDALRGTPLTKSSHPAYDTNFGGRYAGTLGANIPIEAAMPKTFSSLLREMEGKKGDLRNMAIGAMQTRKEGFSELVDKQTIDSVNRWLESQR